MNSLNSIQTLDGYGLRLQSNRSSYNGSYVDVTKDVLSNTIQSKSDIFEDGSDIATYFFNGSVESETDSSPAIDLNNVFDEGLISKKSPKFSRSMTNVINLPDMGLDANNGFAFSFFYKRDPIPTPPEYYGYVLRYSSNNVTIAYEVTDDINKIRVFYYFANSSVTQQIISVDAGVWNHVIINFKVGETFEVIVNKEVKYSTPVTSTGQSIVLRKLGYYYNGSIDIVRFFNRTITDPNQIDMLYNEWEQWKSISIPLIQNPKQVPFIPPAIKIQGLDETVDVLNNNQCSLLAPFNNNLNDLAGNYNLTTTSGNYITEGDKTYHHTDISNWTTIQGLGTYCQGRTAFSIRLKIKPAAAYAGAAYSFGVSYTSHAFPYYLLMFKMTPTQIYYRIQSNDHGDTIDQAFDVNTIYDVVIAWGDSECTVYIDGVAISTVATGAVMPNAFPDAMMGRIPALNGSAHTADVICDELRVFDNKLTSTEVLELHADVGKAPASITRDILDVFNDGNCKAFYPLKTDVNDVSGAFNATEVDIAFNNYYANFRYTGDSNGVTNNTIMTLPSLGMGRDFSYSLAIKMMKRHRYHGMLIDLINYQDDYYIRVGVQNTGKLLMSSRNSDGTSMSILTTEPITLGVEHSITASFKDNGLCQLFLDGKLVGSGTSKTMQVGGAPAASQLYIGNSSVFQYYYIGEMRQLRCFNRSLDLEDSIILRNELL